MSRPSRVLAWVVVAVCAAAAIGFVVIAIEYHRFSADVSASGAGLPTGVRAALPPSPGTLDHAQTTLVRGIGPLASGGGLLFRTVPSQATTAYLVIPPSSTLGGARVGRQRTAALIDQLGRDAGIPIAHAAVIQLSNVAPLVDAMGGIDVRNPRPFRTVVSSGWWSVPRGVVHLDGRHAVAYLTQGRPNSTQRNTAEERVLAAVIGQALGPSSVSQLQTTGAAIAATAATDLTDADILGMVWARLETRHVVQCTAPEQQPLEAAAAQKVIRAFLAPAGEAGTTGCQSKAARPSSFLPPRVVVALVQQYGAWAFALIAVVASVILAAVSAVLLGSRIWAPTRPAGRATRGRTHGRRRRRGHAPRTQRSGPQARRSRRARHRDRARHRLAAQPQTTTRVSKLLPSAIIAIRTRIASFLPAPELSRPRKLAHAALRKQRTRSTRHAATPSPLHRPSRHYRRRAHKFLYDHPDAIWIVVCVTASLAIAMLISSV